MIVTRQYTDKEIDLICSEMVVCIDSREKANQHIIDMFSKSGIKYEVMKLDFADYTFRIPSIPELEIQDTSFANEISIERKNSIDEIAGNFTTGRERFKREFERHKGQMILAIECGRYKDIFDHNYQSKMSPQALIGSLHGWSIQYGVPFIFVDKEYMARYIYFAFYYYLKYILKNIKI